MGEGILKGEPVEADLGVLFAAGHTPHVIVLRNLLAGRRVPARLRVTPSGSSGAGSVAMEIAWSTVPQGEVIVIDGSGTSVAALVQRLTPREIITLARRGWAMDRRGAPPTLSAFFTPSPPAGPLVVEIYNLYVRYVRIVQ